MKKEILTLTEFKKVVKNLMTESQKPYYTADLKVTIYAQDDEEAKQMANAYCDMIKTQDDVPCSIQGIHQVFGIGDNRKVDLYEESTFKKEHLTRDDLPKIMDFLYQIGFDVIDYDLDNPTNIAGNPLVRNGMNGIRASYDKKRDKLEIWFTNLYEDPSNNLRKKVEAFIETLF